VVFSNDRCRFRRWSCELDAWKVASRDPTRVRLLANLAVTLSATRLELAQQRCRCRLALAQLCNLALGLLVQALQLGGEVGCTMLYPGGALSKGCKLNLHLLLLAGPGGGCILVSDLLDLECLRGRFLHAARRRKVVHVGLLFLRKVSLNAATLHGQCTV